MQNFKKFSVLILIFAFFQTANARWLRQESGTLAWLHAIFFVNQNKGWIAGSKGTFLTTDDGGKTWRQDRHFTEDNIRDVYFSDAQNGYLLCERDIYNQGTLPASYLLKTENGGASWEKIEFANERARIAKIFFAIGGYGFAVGESGTLLAMQGDKKTWKKTDLPMRFLLLGGSFPNALEGSIVGGNGTVLFTEDAGQTWNPATLAGENRPRLNTVFFINPKTGWTAGSGGKIYATMNGGKYWREQVSNVTQNISDLFFINSAEGYAVGDNGTILHTMTAGNIWSAEESNVKHKLEKIVYSGQKWFAVGFGGTILQYESGKPNEPRPIQPQLQRRNS